MALADSRVLSKLVPFSTLLDSVNVPVPTLLLPTATVPPRKATLPAYPELLP